VLQRRMDASLVQTARSFEHALRVERSTDTRPLEAIIAEEVAELPFADTPLAVFRENGEVVAAPPHWKIARRGRGFVTLDRDTDHAMRVFTGPITVSGQTFLVVVGRRLDDQTEFLEAVRTALLIGIPVWILCAGALGYWFVRKTLQPVLEMSVQQRRFMADASHELRTPVAILQGELDVTLSRHDRNAADYRESLEVMHRTVRRLTRIVRDLFLLARSDAGDIPLHRELLYVDDLVSQTARAYRTLAADRDVAIVAECAEDLRVDGDEDLLQRMIGNLLENAIRHTAHGTEVRVRCLVDGRRARIEVRDRGAGVPVESRQRIFERFYRADPARTPSNGSGAGLGLPIARWIAEVHSGALWLDQTGPDGSLFVATLPLGGAAAGSSRV